MHFIDRVRHKVTLRMLGCGWAVVSQMHICLEIMLSTACACGDISEDAYHYLFVCPRYLVQRDKMITAVCQITSCTIGCVVLTMLT